MMIIIIVMQYDDYDGDKIVYWLLLWPLCRMMMMIIIIIVQYDDYDGDKIVYWLLLWPLCRMMIMMTKGQMTMSLFLASLN